MGSFSGGNLIQIEYLLIEHCVSGVGNVLSPVQKLLLKYEP